MSELVRRDHGLTGPRVVPPWQITAFLSRSGRVRRHGKGDQAGHASSVKDKGKGKAKEETAHEEAPEVLRFTFSLATKDDVGAGKREAKSTASRRVRQRTSTASGQHLPISSAERSISIPTTDRGVFVSRSSLADVTSDGT